MKRFARGRGRRSHLTRHCPPRPNPRKTVLDIPLPRRNIVETQPEGEATREGLWLTSTVTNAVNDRFRVVATAVGRVTPCAPGAVNKTSNIQHPTSNTQLETVGNISLAGETVRFSRPGLTEEYTVS